MAKAFNDVTDPDEEFEIEVVDETPEGDRGKPVAPETSADDEDDDESAYGDKVKKRIAKEAAAKHAERRAKEQAARERDEAIRVAQEAIAQRDAYRNQANQYEQGFVFAAKGKAETEVEQAQAEYQRAFENGDSLAMANAVRKMSSASAQKTQFDSYVPQQVQAPVHQPAQQVQQQPVKIDREEVARQTKFMRENPWFNSDPEMTTRAFEIDQHIRSNPQTSHIVGSDEYYDYIDALMRREYAAERFGGTGHSAPQAPARSNPGVAPVSRGGAVRSPKKITLTESQVKLARRLGITPQQYAAELIKEQSNGR